MTWVVFLAGCVVGFDIGIGYAWQTTRRANRAAGVAARVKPYVERRWPW